MRGRGGVRLLCGAAALAALVLLVGPAPFAAAVRAVDPGLLVAAMLANALATWCTATRWRLVAASLGGSVSGGAAVAACYRAQLLNLTLPGGVLGDVHRGLAHGAEHGGREHGGTGRALRGVGYERGAGQAVQVVLTAAVLLALPSPLRPVGAWLAVALLVLAVVVALAARSAGLRRMRLWAAAAAEVRATVLAPGVWPGVVLLSVGALAAYVSMFALAVRAAGAALPWALLPAVALVVLLAAALPIHLAGWGPREGAAAWAFAAVGLTPAEGVTAAAVFGLMALAAATPGALVLLARPGRSGRPALAVSGRG